MLLPCILSGLPRRDDQLTTRHLLIVLLSEASMLGGSECSELAVTRNDCVLQTVEDRDVVAKFGRAHNVDAFQPTFKNDAISDNDICFVVDIAHDHVGLFGGISRINQLVRLE
jgi:hypothetical protein